MKTIKTEHGLIKGWWDYVPVEEEAIQQLVNVANLPFIHKWVASMADAHVGKGATIGSVIATDKALIPSAVGVDLSCAMSALQTDIKASELPESLSKLRNKIEQYVPVGFNVRTEITPLDENFYTPLAQDYKDLCENANGKVTHKGVLEQIGTLGGGNHFIEICIDENQYVWVMLHSGSRGAGNKIGTYYIEQAKLEMEKYFISLPDKDLAYLVDGTPLFKGYVDALDWASKYATANRELMMTYVKKALEEEVRPFNELQTAINCHHNYVSREHHYGKNVYVTRKGALRARKGELGIIPSSMGAKSLIVRGLGNEESFCSCSHGAGRVMSRTKAKKLISLDEHLKDTQGVECRKDIDILDESPKAYKNIDDVMRSQEDLVEIMHTLKQVLCVKG
jgi:tRNA-splicing ligase RtcB